MTKQIKSNQKLNKHFENMFKLSVQPFQPKRGKAGTEEV